MKSPLVYLSSLLCLSPLVAAVLLLEGPGAIAALPASPRSIVAQRPELATGDMEPEESPAEGEEGETPKGPADPAALKPFAEVVEDLERSQGLFTLYQKPDDNTVLLEIRPDQFNHHYLLSATINAGVGEFGLYRGIPLQEFAFTLRRFKNTLQIIVPNSLFRDSRPPSQSPPLETDLFSDSVVFTLPILSEGEESNTVLVDFSPLLLDPATGFGSFSLLSVLGYGADASQSYVRDAAAFPQNLEFDLTYRFTGSPADALLALSTLPDPSSFNLGLHYSLSQLPVLDTYRPRVADERVGYFVTAYQDLAKTLGRDRFVRYINRWHLEKEDPQADLSPPVKPIVFWIDKAMPPQYRQAVEEGVLMWNPAFEAIGFQNALEVRQMPEDADWDAADSRYNTIRWTDSVDGGFALAMPRTSPITGEILGADIVMDANMLRYTGSEYIDLVNDPLGSAVHWGQLTQQPGICDASMAMAYIRSAPVRQWVQRWVQSPAAQRDDRCYGLAASQQLAVGSMVLSMVDNALPSSAAMQDYVHQFVRHVIAHEVGHTLGLRHNFHASTLRDPHELQDRELTQREGLVGSLMDYVPVNLAPPDLEQGEYFPSSLGPYDYWAIAYGYTPLDSLTPQAERNQLQAIARQAPDPALDYGTDEDLWSALDPTVAAFDLSSDPLTYNTWQMDIATDLWGKLDKRFPSQGRSYTEARPIFSQLLNHYFLNASLLSDYVGGRSLNRYQGGDAPDRRPFEPIPVETQRQALALLEDRVFSADAFEFPPELPSKLGVSRWFHQGSFPAIQDLEYPLADSILIRQTFILGNLLMADRLERLRDGEVMYPTQESLTLPELFDSLQAHIWLDPLADRGSDLPLLQRRLQNQYVSTLLSITDPTALETATSLPDIISWIFTYDAPEEARSLARYQLNQLDQAITSSLNQGNLSLTTRTHLEGSRDRIRRILNP
ncbi:zinc-dependent metalloprotease [Prochlorothrix hollandica]|uniref:zinc-dependent metalloprotease n=1 Tax=Prochlorothrix hollandica TaxID=1223 RepID=UPI0003465397|nr:zinc-dependent metalloprotease [Prochlorothrix hollandica]